MSNTDKENEFDLVNCVQNNSKKFGNSFHDFDSDYSQRCGHGCGLKESDVINSLNKELKLANETVEILNKIRDNLQKERREAWQELEKARELIKEELDNRGIKFKNREDLWNSKAKEFLKREGE